MNMKKALVIGMAGGVVLWLYNFVMHGVIMANTYMGNPVFRQDPSNPLWFLLIEVCMASAWAMIFVKTRSAWADGPMGGATLGFLGGLIGFFAQFINPLVISDFPYYLAWCWGGIVLIGWVLLGVVAGMMYKTAA